MSKANVRSSERVQFLSNPQRQGVWALGIQPDPSSRDSLLTLLNLRDSYGYRYGFFESDFDEVHRFPCRILPRLFAYLRSLLPAKLREGLPALVPSHADGTVRHRGVFGPPYVRYSFIQELANEPRKVSNGKKGTLSKAARLFSSDLRFFTLAPVPERPSVLDFVSREDKSYFQAEEDADGRLNVYSLEEETCNLVRRLIEAIPNLRVKCESRKLFSPEDRLLAMYMPTLSLVSDELALRDATVRRTIAQAMMEVREERFVHAIRAIGIGAEELIVEVYETFLHEKAPEAPLGNLLAELNTGIQEVIGGARARRRPPRSEVQKLLGTALGAEKRKAGSNAELCALLEVVLQSLVPTLEQLGTRVAELEELAVQPQKTAVFPAHVNRALSDLVPLRNRVSHRVDRLSSARTVTYLETALALKSYIVVALWWQEERQKIDYRAGMNEAIKKAIDRNRAETLG